ncbi:multidrug transporter [Dyella solisilvae]|uniref:Multidrug transporter n=1 Tax=Dyella solisilvae TaxID=1920168 RepID=A0A370KBY8_9GAMM|nr:multidrug transporter [Dyella solisilvae]RDJ00166.1 multidrug transporter [Dyella solisilvae]
MKTDLLPTERLVHSTELPGKLAPVRPSPLAIVPRLAGYGVMAFIAWLLLSTLLEPWVSTKATRAVLNAPAMLITTPISGTVSELHAQNGQPLEPGQTIAVVKNDTVARDALTTLLTQRLDLQGRLDDLNHRITADQRLLEYASDQYQQYQSANVAQLQNAYASMQAQQDAASAKVTELDNKVARAMTLQRDGAVSAATVSAAQAQADTARSEADALDKNVEGVGQSLAAAKRGVYVASGQSSNDQLTQLAQRRTDLQSNITSEQAQIDALNTQLGNLNTLVAHEQDRVHALSDYVVKAYGQGTTQDIVAPVGTQVSAGATLVRATDCSKTGVVAVFPARMAGRLNVGTELKVSIASAGRAHSAHITQLLPTAKESLQNSYSAPFPYAEDGSVYALAQWDDRDAANAGIPPCTPGRSVIASLR